MGVINQAEPLQLYRFCNGEVEASLHTVGHCKAVIRVRLLHIGEEKPKASKYLQELGFRLLSLIKKKQIGYGTLKNKSAKVLRTVIYIYITIKF